MNNIESIVLERSKSLFEDNFCDNDLALREKICGKSFLVIGAGGSIGSACAIEIFKRKAGLLHCVDLSENGLVELVRDVRSSFGYATAEFDTFAIDCGSSEFYRLLCENQYDYVLNLSAMKHVRSESSVYGMIRMLQTNIINTLDIYRKIAELGSKKYFCVSTDKAANPTNFMGATKRSMEMCLFGSSTTTPISSARFANVAFSQGSLLDGFTYRLKKHQPLSAPNDIQRYFITPEEAGQICLLSTLYGEHGEIFFPYSEKQIELTSFQTIIENFLELNNLKPAYCETEDEARSYLAKGHSNRFWPVHLFESDTTGEKPFEEFYTEDEKLILNKFVNLASVIVVANNDLAKITEFESNLRKMDKMTIRREDLIKLVKDFIVNFDHLETGKFLNQRM